MMPPRLNVIGRGDLTWRGHSSDRIIEMGGIMRFIQAIILLAFLGALGLFAVQNTEAITVAFWTWKATGPVAILAIVAYFLGMVSGGTVVSIFRRSLQRVSERPAG
jgi:putative membrane protein